jgi:hypothetical protein
MYLGLKDAACEYWKLGCNIVVLKDKKPLHDWLKWVDERQSETELAQLPWQEATQYAVICGTKLENGMYFTAVDLDRKNLHNEIIEKGEEVLKHLPVTRTEQTPSKGLHRIYYSNAKPDTISAFHNVAAVELLGTGKLCIMAPSERYTRLNDNPPTEVADLTAAFYSAINSCGIQIQERKTSWFDREDLGTKAYKGQSPPCINRLERGTSEGLRNEFGIRLVAFYLNFRQYQTQTVQRMMKNWNKLNTPSLVTRELECIMKSAAQGNYVYGCEDNVLKNFCDSHVKCPLRKKPTQPTQLAAPTFDADIEEKIDLEVQRILDADNQLDALKPHLDNLAVGEDNTKKSLVVLLRSAKEHNVESKQIIILKATEGAGKSSLISKLAQGYKVKEVARFSAHALDYTNLESYEILFLKELGSMDEEKQGVSTVKFLSSDDRGYTVEITTKDEETGKWATQQYKIPPITVVSSTTRLILDSQFERRSWPLGLDETPEQTERIKKWKAKLHRQNDEKLLGIRKTTDYEFSAEVYRRFVEKTESKKIIVPFPEKLLDVLGIEALRVRGDFDKLLTFVKLYGSMNFRRLQQIQDDVYALTPEVAVEALQIALEPLSAMLSRIDKRSRKVLDSLNDVIQEAEAGCAIDKAVREKIARRIGKSEKTVRDFFNQLENSGYVSSNQKKPKTFTLLYDVDEIQTKLSGISAKIESTNLLMDGMQKEASGWLKAILENFSPRIGQKSSDMDKVAVEGDRHGAEQNEPTLEKEISNPSLASFQADSTESESEYRQVQKLPIVPEEKQNENSGLVSCPFCKGLSKNMFFVCDTDLAAHVKAFHNGHPEYVR